MRHVLAVLILILFIPTASAATLYTYQKLDDSTYAAVVDPRGPVESNALIIITPVYVVVAGAHFSADAAAELTRTIAKLTPLPLRYVIVTHHHRGNNHLDFDFPRSVEIVTSLQNWKSFREEYRSLKNPVVTFDRELILKAGMREIILTNMDNGHSNGDVVVYLPDRWVLFTSDLVFNDEAGFMGDGHARGWVANLQSLETLTVTKVVPGRGPVTDLQGVKRFRIFLQEFLTETLNHVEKNENVPKTLKYFRIPPERAPRNFSRYYIENIDWAWRELKKKP